MPRIARKKQSNPSVTWAAVKDWMLTSYCDRHNMAASGGWIYAISEDQTPLVKIGYTRSGTRIRLHRLAYALQSSVTLLGIVAVRRNVTMIEQQVHTLLAAQRIEGEWFYLHMNQDLLRALVLQTPGGKTLLCLREEPTSPVPVGANPGSQCQPSARPSP